MSRRLSLALGLALCCSLAPAFGASLFDPATMVREQELHAGMKGYGLSVFAGTRIERFDLTVLGVLEKIDFGANLILVRITSGPPRRCGVVAGMSGSPVYVGGKLAGAISLAFPFSREPIAGVTPIAQMLENYQPGSVPPPPALSGSLRARQPLLIAGKRYQQALVVPTPAQAAASQGLVLTPIATPLLVSNATSRALGPLSRALERYGIRVFSASGAAPPQQVTRLQPGSAVGMQLLSGDMDAVAVGTVTYLKDGLVLAFGHPLMNLGSIDMPLVGAYVHAVVPALDLSFKMASGTGVLGRFTQDRSWSVGGTLGQQAQTTRLELAVEDLDRGNSRHYSVRVVRERELTPMLIYSSLFASVESLAPALKGTTSVKLEMSAPGLPALQRENSYAQSSQGSLWETLMAESPYQVLPLGELMELMDTLENNRFGPIPVECIKVAVAVTQKRRTAVIERAYADRQKVRPGEVVHVAVDIQPYGEPKTRRELEVKVPENAPPGSLRIGIGGGASASRFNSAVGVTRPKSTSLAQMVQQICDRERSTDLLVETVFSNGSLLIGGVEMTDLPNSLLEMVRSSPISSVSIGRNHYRTTLPMPWVLSGSQVLRFTVETDQKEKVGAPPALTISPFAGEDFSQMFEGLLRGTEEGTSAHPALGRPVQAEQDDTSDAAAEGGDELGMPEWEEVESLGERISTTTSTVSSAGTTGKGRTSRSWVQATAAQFAAGKLEGAAISGDALTVGPVVTPLLSRPDRLLWTAAVGSDQAYVACWLAGEVLSLQGGEVKSLLKLEDPAVSSLAAAPDGILWVAAMPSGQIYRVAADGTAQPHCRLAGDYIWALAPGPGGSLYAATGPRGRLMRIDAAGQAQALFTAPDRHLTAMALAGDGTAFVGTYPLGKVFRVQPDGQAQAYFEVPKYAIQSLALDQAGNLFVGTTPKAEVYRVAPDGNVTQLYQGSERHVHTLLPDGQGGVYAGTGQPARVLHLQADATVDILYEPKAAHLLTLVRQGGDLLGLESGSGRLVRLALGTAASGRYLSPMLDAGAPAHFGRLNVTGSGAWSVETRSGNTAAPDPTWSAWAPLAAASRVASPEARYLQYRLTLAGQPSPRLQRVELLYRARNRQPSLKVTAPVVGDIWSAKKTIRFSAQDPDSDRLANEVFTSANAGKTWKLLAAKAKEGDKEAKTEAETAAPAKPAPDKPKPAQAAPAADENSGEETPAADEQGEEAADASPLSSASSGKCEWDTTRLPDGSYLVKVVVSDRKDNPDHPLTAEKICGPIIVDNSKPLISRGPAPAGSPLPFAIVCRDLASYVAAAHYRVDGGEWLAASTADAVFDAPEEILCFDPAALPAGGHRLEVRARDAAGNERTATFPYSRLASPPAP